MAGRCFAMDAEKGRLQQYYRCEFYCNLTTRYRVPGLWRDCGSGPCTQKYLWIHPKVEVLRPRLRLCPRDSCMCEPHCTKTSGQFFSFFHTRTSCLQLLLAACQVLAFLYGFKAASRPCGPCQSSICTATHATSTLNSQKSDSLVGTWRWLTLAYTWHHTLLRLCHAVSILFLPPSRRPRFGCPSHCQFSLWAAAATTLSSQPP
ncbi:hypothetical protein BDP81DRAFT_426434 [Colletotrichum phormii]|uniref:Uncharacterized protein n=1 Tax=Colletotrichum phormii TaxID=359342 RepID=A0AAJ0EEG4_9PEZI|nr:uncharacterized protein BDP81DRAFT_426434 [Colletotrichum phormii]KAK1636997.1 hypothetical protein BDP81DRAFT_426434 [Colletotrichum phormii]